MDFWNNLWGKSFQVKGYRIALHIIFWVLYYLAFSFWTYYLLSVTGWRGKDLLVSFWVSMVMNVIIVSLSYYTTIATAYTYLVKKQRYGWFFLLLLLNLGFFCLILIGGRDLTNKLLPYLGVLHKPDYVMEEADVEKGIWFFAQMIISYFALLCLPVASKFFRDQLRQQQRERNLEKQNIQLQMDFLKAQIHPHFLFNTLNNIYSLSLNAQPEKASEMISRLSDLLRYVLYKGKKEYISLNDEVAMVRNFIDLEAIRSDNLDITTELPEPLDTDIFLPPFLLLPLVENAFKHGVNSQLDQSLIKIRLTISQDALLLEVENSFDQAYRKKNEGGFGLDSLRKRLEYYYLNDFSLTTKERKDHFIDILKLTILCPKYSA
jgi:hypothetical protein